MKSPNKQKPGTLGGGVGPGRAETTNLESQYSPTALPFRHIHWRPALYSLAIKDAAPGITQSLLVRAWSREIREALR